MDIEKGPLMLLGPTMNPREAFELSQRLPHMSMRVKAQCDRAMELAKKMKAEFPKLKVIYPGLKDHPQHKLLASMHNEGYGFGAIIAIDVNTGDRANDLLDKLENDHKFGFVAVSLGYYENLMCASGMSTARDIDRKTKQRLHITDGLIRLSIGYLGTFEQKWCQFKQAYEEMIHL